MPAQKERAAVWRQHSIRDHLLRGRSMPGSRPRVRVERAAARPLHVSRHHLHASCERVHIPPPRLRASSRTQTTDAHPAWIGRAWSPCSARPSRSPLCRCHRVGPSRRANTTTLRDCVCSWRQILDLHSATSSTDSCWASRRHTGTGRRHTGTGRRHAGTGRRHAGFGRRGSAPGSLASS